MAVAIWKRVRAKLEGRHVCGQDQSTPKTNAKTSKTGDKLEPDSDVLSSQPQTKRSVPHQVQAAIREAMAPTNLCQMYEGWTPWI